MGVFRGVDLGGILEKTFAVHAITLEICDLDRTTAVSFNNVGATVRDTAISARFSSSRGTSVSVDTKVLGDTTLALDVTTGI
jgi:hypothetical protein